MVLERRGHRDEHERLVTAGRRQARVGRPRRIIEDRPDVAGIVAAARREVEGRGGEHELPSARAASASHMCAIGSRPYSARTSLSLLEGVSVDEPSRSPHSRLDREAARAALVRATSLPRAAACPARAACRRSGSARRTGSRATRRRSSPRPRRRRPRRGRVGRPRSPRSCRLPGPDAGPMIMWSAIARACAVGDFNSQSRNSLALGASRRSYAAPVRRTCVGHRLVGEHRDPVPAFDQRGAPRRARAARCHLRRSARTGRCEG